MPAAPPEIITPAVLREWSLPRPEGSKYGRGHVLVVGGARSTPGAAMLAGLGALRVGAGVLCLAVAESVAASVAVAVPECSVESLPEGSTSAAVAAATRRLAPRVDQAEVVVVGPGLDDAGQTRALLEALLPLVPASTELLLDAYALGVLPDVLGGEPYDGALTLTPNPAEAAHLLDREDDDGDDDEGADPAEVSRQVAQRFSATVSYQNHISDPAGRTWFVPTGHDGLGTSGSGDVMAGALAGLLARGADRPQAACWGTYLHAAAGDRLAARIGRTGFLARELLDELPQVLTELEA
jgi:ADP-dependent NAD(P)H-hydrate dehydratase